MKEPLSLLSRACIILLPPIMVIIVQVCFGFKYSELGDVNSGSCLIMNLLIEFG